MSLVTKRALAASLKKLLAQKTLDKITVKDIVEDCGVNRHTFYYHFQDIYDLMEWIFSDDADRILGNRRTYEQWQEGILSIFNYLMDNKPLILNAYHSISREHLERYVTKLARPLLYNIATELSQGMQIAEEKKNFVVDVFIYSLVGISFKWIEDNMRDSYDNMLEMFFQLIDGSMKSALLKFSTKN